MSRVKVNKSGLDSAASDFKSKVSQFESEVSDAVSALNSVPSHSDFPSLTSKAKKIANALEEINLDYNHLGENISNYIASLNQIDQEGFDTSPEALASLNNVDTSMSVSTGTEAPTTMNLSYSNPSSSGNYSYSYTTGPSGTSTSSGFTGSTGPGSTPLVYTSATAASVISTAGTTPSSDISAMANYVDTEEGREIAVPAGLGSQHTYMGWQLITAPSSMQYKLRESAGMNFDAEGFGRIGDRYVVATTTTFGQVGDFIDVYKEDGTVLKCIIGDIKSQGDAGCTMWGHNNGQNVIEFVVDRDSWYGGHENPGSASCHPEWNQNITKIVNKGNYFDLMNNAEVVTL